MGNGYEVDMGVLEGIAGTLRSAASDLDGLGDSVPAAPDAGEASGPMGEMMAHLVRTAGQYSMAVSAVSDRVAQGSTAYLEQEQNTAQSLPDARVE